MEYGLLFLPGVMLRAIRRKLCGADYIAPTAAEFAVHSKGRGIWLDEFVILTGFLTGFTFTVVATFSTLAPEISASDLEKFVTWGLVSAVLLLLSAVWNGFGAITCKWQAEEFSQEGLNEQASRAQIRASDIIQMIFFFFGTLFLLVSLSTFLATLFFAAQLQHKNFALGSVKPLLILLPAILIGLILLLIVSTDKCTKPNIMPTPAPATAAQAAARATAQAAAATQAAAQAHIHLGQATAAQAAAQVGVAVQAAAATQAATQAAIQAAVLAAQAAEEITRLTAGDRSAAVQATLVTAAQAAALAATQAVQAAQAQTAAYAAAAGAQAAQAAPVAAKPPAAPQLHVE